MSTRTRRTETAAFPATEASVGEARRWLSKILDGNPCCDDAALLLSEAATNALVHTDSSVIGVTVVIEESDDVRIDVADEGAETVPSMPPNPDGDLTSSGRGIRLIRALSSRWGFTEERPSASSGSSCPHPPRRRNLARPPPRCRHGSPVRLAHHEHRSKGYAGRIYFANEEGGDEGRVDSLGAAALLREAEPGEWFDQLALLVRQVGQQRVGEQVHRGPEGLQPVRLGHQGDQRSVDAFENLVDRVMFLLKAVDDRRQLGHGVA